MTAGLVQRNIQDFREGENVIINVGMLTEGFDAPRLKVSFCRPTNSQTLYLQSIGRGTRFPKSSKDTFYAVDFVDNLTRHQDSLVTVDNFFMRSLH